MKPSNREIADLCRNLAQLLHAGIPLADGLYLLSREETGEWQSLLSAMGKQLDDGCPLAQAMEESGVFSNQVCGMVRTGEAAGRLEEALCFLADYHDQRCRTERQLRQALAYPAAILLLMLGVIAVLLTKVLPIFDGVYASLGSRLTGAAAGLLHLGQLLEKTMPVLLAMLVLVAAVVLLYSRWGAFREGVNACLTRCLGDKGPARRYHNARFARALAMGLGSGLALEEALSLASRLLADVPGAAARCRQCEAQLAAGTDLGAALEGARLLTATQGRMLTIGLRTGNADRVMADLADRLEAEAEEALEALVAKVEPAMVLLCSVLVGGILLTVMLPLMDIMSTIG